MPDERAQIRAIGRGLTEFTERQVRKVTLDLTAELVRETPVDTGWARNNWVPRVGRPETEPVGAPGNPGPGAAARSAGEAQVLGYRLGQGSVFVTNNVPYIEALNDGHSPQAPAGWVQRAIRRVLSAVGFS